MNQVFTERANAATDRYGVFIAMLRAQADTVFRSGPTDEALRSDAFHIGLDAARGYATMEHAELNDDTQTVAIAAHKQALTDLGARDESIPDRFADFIFSASLYAARLIAAQAERDVMSMSQHIHTMALRIDLYVRSGRHTHSSAAAAVMIEDMQSPAFKFIDRMGRRFKSSKHIRDTYRAHLMNVYNEVYMDVVATAGHDIIRVRHPDAGYKWHGQPLLIVSGREGFPLYYDVKDEIFHPGSEATLTIQYPGD